MAEYGCRPGFRLLGDAKRLCHEGRWDGKTPLCGADVGGGKPAFFSSERSANATIAFATDVGNAGLQVCPFFRLTIVPDPSMPDSGALFNERKMISNSDEYQIEI